MSATMKSLRIKTGSCKRLLKELQAYEKEVERETAKTNRMKEEGVDFHDLKQQENVLAESKMMVPDCTKRLEAAVGELRTILEEAEAESTQGSEEIQEAKILVSEIEARLDH